ATFSAVLCVAVIVVCGAQSTTEFTWDLPKGFPMPAVPADNPMSVAKVELGRHLFYDLRLSGNGQQSCATCHQQEKAFTDGLKTSAGSTGEDHPRNSMSLVNVAYAATLTWANPTMTRLEDQALVPMFGRHPIELGLGEDREWLDPLRREARYVALFERAFPGEADGFTRINVVRALATFQRTIVSGRSPYDRYHFERDDQAVSAAAKRGEVLFHSRRLACFTCHGGFNFSGATRRSGSSESAGGEFHNTGLYNLPGLLSYPAPNTGIHEFTRDPKDVGRFKAPTLRNIAVTAPYMHDGSIDSLEGVLAHYEAGGRTLTEGPHKGVGNDNPNKSERIRGFALTSDERDDLIAFLRSLTDESLLRDARFANPWRR
ncbi:MAG: MbnH family di-heme enzyme, partial [Burkholderiales bacterium]